MIKVLHYVSLMNRGGQETFIMNVYRNIDREKIQFDFLCSDNKKGDYDDEIKLLGGKIIYLDIKRKGGKFTKYLNATSETAKFLSHISNDYDIAHLHNYHAFSSFLSVKAFKKAGFKHIILHSHNSCAPRIRLHNFFKPMLARQKVIRFACSQQAGEWMHGNKPFEVIYNGIDVAEFCYDKESRLRLRKELGLSENFVVGMVGRFNYQKNHVFALDVFNECCKTNPEARLVLVGRGELENDIKRKIEDLNLQDKVILLGVRDDVNKLMSAFDVLLMPSLFEGLSIVMIEAQYCRLPIVASDNLSKEVFISNLLNTVSLQENAKVWADNVIRVKEIDRDGIAIENDLFDIRAVAADLTGKYKRIAEVSD